ncbi:MAG: hypothetical protein RE471_01580 [Ferroplasma sp.]|uniref:hypothetical protein n=1 Tax=Ferroplasma sp. TaxID=2591003 RepID=UPI0028157A35|nr:hypothetical protein [Ferroplasma sp.]WMT51586.1 MAG: hypothetical protein RE471_01580 [Ferroplasma sp.]
MLEEDYRNISCGGDPFNFLLSTMKSIGITMEEKNTVKLMVMDAKFRYSDEIFKKMARYSQLEIESIVRENGEIYLFLRKIR